MLLSKVGREVAGWAGVGPQGRMGWLLHCEYKGKFGWAILWTGPKAAAEYEKEMFSDFWWLV
jgi:hypothetical protein